MSQIIGIICDHCIIVASESQYSRGMTKTTDQPKIKAVVFKDQKEALIAFAGDVSGATDAINRIEEMAKFDKLDSPLALVNIAKLAIRKYRQERLEFYNLVLDANEQDEFFGREAEYFELMLAHYFEDGTDYAKPCLFTINVASGKYASCSPYAVTGIGSDLATAILEQFSKKPFTWVIGVGLAVEVLERIKEANIWCGGNVKIAGLDLDVGVSLKAVFYTESLQLQIVQKLKELRERNNVEYASQLLHVFNEITQENMKKNP